MIGIEANRIVAGVQDIQVSLAVVDAVNQSSHPDVAPAKANLRIAIRQGIAGVFPASARRDPAPSLQPFHDQRERDVVRNRRANPAYRRYVWMTSRHRQRLRWELSQSMNAVRSQHPRDPSASLPSR